jgi:hypothetical protein
MKDCTLDTCQGDNRIKNCQCYKKFSGGVYDQQCAYEENGFLIPCNAGCCNNGNGCPGECTGAIDAPPYRDGIGLKRITGNDMSIDRAMNTLTFFMIALLIISTSMLLMKFIGKGLKKTREKIVEQTNGNYGLPPTNRGFPGVRG